MSTAMRRIEDEFNCPSCGTRINREIGVFTDQALRSEIEKLRRAIANARTYISNIPKQPSAAFDLIDRELQEALK